MHSVACDRQLAPDCRLVLLGCSYNSTDGNSWNGNQVPLLVFYEMVTQHGSCLFFEERVTLLDFTFLNFLSGTNIFLLACSVQGFFFFTTVKNARHESYPEFLSLLTCVGTQSPWPGYPVSSFQSPTLMEAWTDVSHSVWFAWSLDWGAG